MRFPLLALAVALGACTPFQWPLRGAFDPFPVEIAMQPPNGARDVDPRAGVKVTAEGRGVRLEKVEVRAGDGRPLQGTLNGAHFSVTSALQFGTRYRVTAVAVSALGEQVARDLEFATVDVPRLDGPGLRPIGNDDTVTLSFDRPAGRLEVGGDVEAKVEPDASRRTFRVILSRYSRGSTIPVSIRWETPAGVPLPPLALQFTSAPPLKTELSLQGQSNLGLALPLELRFAEGLAERDKVAEALVVQTEAGVPVEGRWQWVTEQRLRFSPKPQWPAASTIQVRAEPGRLRSEKGAANSEALLGSFQTGADRKIVVYLDSQRLAAIENGEVVKTIKVSTGKPATPTVTGSFYIYARYPRKTMRSLAKPGEPGHYVVENVPYAQYFHADYALHGAWWHNGFGRPASHGCVNVPTRTNNRRWPKAPEEAGWLYDWAALGVPVTVQRHASR